MKPIFFFLYVLFLSIPIAAQQELLKEQDIPKVMQQLFKQHVDKKGMTAATLHNSLRIFIDQFDSRRTYLLESEVKPYLEIDDETMSHILRDYQQNDLSTFRQLSLQMRHAIERARKFRKEIIQNPDIIPSSHEVIDNKSFAKTSPALKDRIANDIALYISLYEKRLGKEHMDKIKKTIILAYDKRMQIQENMYLGADESGQPLTEPENENLFVMHVLKALAGSLDSHTKVLDSSEAHEMRLRLEKRYSGVGVQLANRDGEVIISRVLEKSPAAESGKIKVGDVLLSVDGQPVENETIENVLNWLRGEKGTITLEIKRNYPDNGGEPFTIFTVKLDRRFIPINEGRVEVSSEPFEDGIIGKIALHAFYQGSGNVNSESDMRAAIKQLEKQGKLKGLVIDLRDNTGGFLMQSVKVAGLFITNGVVVISKYADGTERVYRDLDSREIYHDRPLVILTSKETASAAEIMAEALQDYGVALIVGDEQTYGKGTIQSQTVTGDSQGKTPGSFFKVTVGKYYTVSGKTPQLHGVKADIIVPSTIGQMRIGEEFLPYTVSGDGNDTIKPTYADPLSDIDTRFRGWFQRYYTPTLQERVTKWRELIPTLRVNSQARLATNRKYQASIRQAKAGRPAPFTENDPQMEEAVNIVKDMIRATDEKQES